MPESLEHEIRTLESILGSERDPEGRAFAPLADACLRAGDTRRALDLLTDGLSKQPEFASGHVVATRLYLQQGMHGEAQFAARRVLELDAENVMALAALAEALEGTGDSVEASRIRTTLEELDPDFASDEVLVALAHPVDGSPAASATAAEPEILESADDDWLAAASLEAEPEPMEEAADVTSLAPAAEPDLEDAVDPASLAPDEPAEEPVDVTSLAPEAEPEPEDAVDLSSLAPDEPAEEPVDVTSFAPEAEPEPEDAVDIASLAPDEPAEEPVDVTSLAPEAEPEPEDAVDIASLAPDEPMEDAVSVAPDAEPLGSGASLAPEAERDNAMDLSSLAPDEPLEDTVSVASLAPEAEPEPEDAVDLASLAPDEPMEDAVAMASLAPDAEADDVVDLSSLAPDDPGTRGLAALVDAVGARGDEVGTNGVARDGQSATDEPAEPIYTRTLADVYMQQGFVDQALEVLQHLREEDPDAGDVLRRIAELEGGDDEPSATQFAPQPGPVDSADEETEALARDLAASGADEHDVDTPFAWTEADPDEPPSEPTGPQIGDYFDRLLGWRQSGDPS